MEVAGFDGLLILLKMYSIGNVSLDCQCLVITRRIRLCMCVALCNLVYLSDFLREMSTGLASLPMHIIRPFASQV
jgi:hypothetical protein